MKFIILNRAKSKFYLQASRILALRAMCDEGGTWISIGRMEYGIRVDETPEQIIELIKQQEQS